MLSARDVSQVFGVHVATVYRWSHRGLIAEPVKFGRTQRWRKRDIERITSPVEIQREIEDES